MQVACAAGLRGRPLLSVLIETRHHLSAGPLTSDVTIGPPVPHPVTRHVPAWAWSALLHAALLSALAFMPLRQSVHDPAPQIRTSWEAERPSHPEVDPVEIQFVTHASTGASGASPQASAAAARIPSPGTALAVSTTPHLSLASVMGADSTSRPAGSLTPLLDAAGVGDAQGEGTGTGGGQGDGNGGGFFGVRAEGKRFVYVVDCSRSMNYPHQSEAKTRFRRLKLELVKSIGGMSSEMEFFIVFFNHEMIPMPAGMPQRATYESQYKYLYWMQTIPAQGETNPTSAFRTAVAMKPDVIYFLTDGSFTYAVERDLLQIAQGKTTVHTFVFAELPGTSAAAALQFLEQDRPAEARRLLTRQQFEDVKDLHRSRGVLRQIAERNGGEFKIIP